jgi:probable HAF family extracellular repeat protein
MKTQLLVRVSALVLLVAVWGPIRLAAQTEPADAAQKHSRYKLVDLGTLGGPIAYGTPPPDMDQDQTGFRLLNQAGVVSSYADTALPDPNAPDLCFVSDCLLAHAFRWKNGVMTDLGALDNRVNSGAVSINAQGWSTGQSQLDIDFPVPHAVLWKHRSVIDLGTLEGGVGSLGVYLNDTGQVIGLADNGIPDPFSLLETGDEIRTFFWENGAMQDIGTLGGPDAAPGADCDNQRRGYIVGSSFVSFTANDSTGIPTLDPFLWNNGEMSDLGNLGGTLSGAQCANTGGDVIGSSTLPGDLVRHAFLWRKGVITDLGTLGGDNSEAIWINERGDVAGSADLPEFGLHDAVLWKDGKMVDLGTVGTDPCSRGRGINARGQVVGGSSDCVSAFLHAFVWDGSGPMLDLNTLIAPGSGLQLTIAININDRGEILAKSIPVGATPVGGNDLGHLVLLIPCGAGNDPDCKAEEGTQSDVTLSSNTSRRTIPAILPARPRTARDAAAVWRAKLLRQYHFPAIRQK